MSDQVTGQPAARPPLDDTDPDASLLVRTWFGDDAAWDRLVTDASAPSDPDGFIADFVPGDDRAVDGASSDDIAAAPGDAIVVFVADEASMTSDAATLAVIDRLAAPHRSFRLTLAAAWEVENNLRLANMDTDDFLDSLDADGVFTGFVDPD